MINLYDHADFFGLEVITTLNMIETMSEFDFVAVWRDEDNYYYLALDTGGSCKSPFESFGSKDQLVGPYNFHEVIRELEKIVENYEWIQEHANLQFAKAVDTLIDTRKV